MNTMDGTVALNVPKTELHLHLDGSLDEAFIAKRALDRGVTLPVASEKLRQYLHNRFSCFEAITCNITYNFIIFINFSLFNHFL